MLNKKKMFVIICACMLILAQGTMALAGTVRAAATQGHDDTKSVTYGGCLIAVSASCHGKTASGSANASSPGGTLDCINGCTYEFFDMDGYSRSGILVNVATGKHFEEWSSTNVWQNKEHAYSAVTY